MPSSWSASLRLELQAPGENLNTWGTRLDTVISLTDAAVAGWLTKALTANYSLSTANGATDEARVAMLKFTGSGAFTVTIPSVSKSYDVWNACTGALTITTGAGDTAVIQPGERVRVMCDGSNVERMLTTDFGSSALTNVTSISGLALPTQNSQAASKQYADNLAFTANAGILPAQAGNAGKFITTDGATASWGPDVTGATGKFLKFNGTAPAWTQPATTDLSDIATYTAQRQAFAIAMALVL